MTEILLRPFADAFMQVGIFVALLVAPFGWAQHRWGGRLDELLSRHARLAPVAAAALTLPPGCGGAIVVMALYSRGAVTFGAAIAALVATMGDASWVLLAGDPLLTLELKGLLLVTGAVTGYTVDALGIAPRRRVDAVLEETCAPASGATGSSVAVLAAPPRADLATRQVTSTAALHAVGVLPAALWVALGVGAVISIPVTFNLVAAGEAYLALGVAGAVVALVVFLHGRCRLADDVGAPPTSMPAVLRHGGYEVAFVTVWVGVAYLIWSVVSHVTGFDGSQLPLLGLGGVVVGALVGLIPGCAVQIVFAGIFLAGGMPLPTLVANTISQDGDALLPLLALEHRSALVATVVTTVPALVVGTALFLLM